MRLGHQAPALRLHAPVPDPATVGATIRLDLPTAGAVRLAVCDALGRRVAVLVEGDRAAGFHVAALPAGLAPGVGVARLAAGSGARAVRLTVAR